MLTSKKKNKDIVESDRLTEICASIPANNLAQLLYDISAICRENQWHSAGLHAFVAAEGLMDISSVSEKNTDVLSI